MRIRSNRGQARILEAIIAIAILFPFAIQLQNYRPPGEYQSPGLYKMGATVFTTLDGKGLLSQLVTSCAASGDWMRLGEAVKGCLPADVSFVLAIYEMQWSVPDPVTGAQELVVEEANRVGHGIYAVSGRASVNYVVNVLVGENLQGYLLSLTIIEG